MNSSIRQKLQTMSEFQVKYTSLIKRSVENFRCGKFPTFAVTEKCGGLYQLSQNEFFSRFSKSIKYSWERRRLIFGRVENRSPRNFIPVKCF